MTRMILAAALIVGAVACGKDEPPKPAARPYKYSHSRELSRTPQAAPPASGQASGVSPSGVSPSGAPAAPAAPATP
jgi:hypothetical protein